MTRDWCSYYKEALVFSPRDNVWDHCPFMWKPAVENGPPDDLDDDDDDDDGQVECWYTEPDLPATIPDDNPSPLEFLYYRYGFLSIEPTAPPEVTLPFNRSTAHRIVGLEAQDTSEPLEHLNSFISSILQGHLPAGHCDLSPTSPLNEAFPLSSRASIRDTVFRSQFLELFEDYGFELVNSPNDSTLLVVHESLSILQMVRVGTQLQLRAELQYLLHNGSQFTLLYSEIQPSASPHFGVLAFPLRDITWKANADDFRAYMSRLKTFFLERPHVAAAAFSRGGIAWRITREVLGIEGSVDAVLSTHPEHSSPVNTRRGKYWFHQPDEGEWFYLVGGYEMLTGT